MERVAVKSSNIASVGYDAASGTLEVEFKPNKIGVASVWEYTPVAREIYEAIINPENSAGSVFHHNVRLRSDIDARALVSIAQKAEADKLAQRLPNRVGAHRG